MGPSPRGGGARPFSPPSLLVVVLPNRHALGRSRDGLTSKVHLAVDGRGLPLALVVTAGNVNDCTVFPQLMNTLRVPRPGVGRPRTRPERVIADKAYSSCAIRTHLRGRGGGRPPAFDPAAYRRRNVIERCINRLKQWRGIATRYDKLAHHYQANITPVSALLWINQDLPVRP